MQRENRRQERTQSDAVAKVKWLSPSGQVHFGRGRILDHSPGGLRIEYGERLEPGCYIVVDAPELGSSPRAGWASVRHCAQKKTKYIIGLELGASGRWNC